MQRDRIVFLGFSLITICTAPFQLQCGTSQSVVSESSGGRSNMGGSPAGGSTPSSGGAESHCADLGKAECAKSNCHAMTARHVDESTSGEGCWAGESVFLGCHELGCPANTPVARDPEGDLWLFYSGCIPEGWVFESSISAADECAAGGGGGGASFGGQGGAL
jgi:hypothetical protein